MRLNSLFAVLVPVAAACGGGSETPTPIPVDTPAPTPDAPANVVCPVNAAMGGLVLAMGAGTDGMGGTADDVPLGGSICGAGGNMPCNWYETPATGPNMTKRTFLLAVGLPPDIDTDTANPDENLIFIELVSTSGTFIKNTPKSFSTDPSVVGSSIAFGSMGTTSYDAAAFVLGNVSSGGMFTHLYSASSGSITLTGTDAGTNAGDVIRGSVNATNFREVDGVAEIAGGCTTALDGLAFAITQGEAAAKPMDPATAHAWEIIQKHKLTAQSAK